MDAIGWYFDLSSNEGGIRQLSNDGISTSESIHRQVDGISIVHGHDCLCTWLLLDPLSYTSSREILQCLLVIRVSFDRETVIVAVHLRCVCVQEEEKDRGGGGGKRRPSLLYSLQKPSLFLYFILLSYM